MHDTPRGRAPLGSTPTVRKQVTLPADLHAAATDLGGGNFSAGVRVALLAWQAGSDTPQELQLWQHMPTRAFYVVLWRGAMVAAVGPLPYAQARAMLRGEVALPAQRDAALADWLDGELDRGNTRRMDVEVAP